MNPNFFQRAISEVLKERAKNAKCILVTGARQVGKSTLLKKLYPNVKYITFDDLLEKAQAEEDPNLFFMNNPSPVIIDEVQKVPNLFPYLKIQCDKTDSYENFYLTGSQSLELMKNVSESLAGRISILELSGFSLREIHKVDFNEPFIPDTGYINRREKKMCQYNDVWQKIHRGSYPELYATERDWLDFYSSYVKTYLERDIYQMIHLKDEIAFMRFMVAAAARSGQILNYANLAEDAGVSQVTVKEWISVLERSGIVFLLQPYYSNNLKRAIKSPKIYFRDTGLVCYLTKWSSPETLKNSAVAGNIFETFVVSEIIKSFANAGIDYKFNVFYYRGKDKSRIKENGETIFVESEIDLIIEIMERFILLR
ncbi:MAG: ATP-binding protein [Spirochaetaceae bacterium]|nr:ATP-binding protein [Spirochaetaceae bacterium]